METIGKQFLWSFIAETSELTEASNVTVRKSTAHRVDTFLRLAMLVAELQFINRDFVLLFRGQRKDFKNNKKRSSLKPELFRSLPGKPWNPKRALLAKRFDVLRAAEDALVAEYKAHQLGHDHLIERQRILRWSILQHYQVCRTPLLDVTHSLRIAASFATHGNDSDSAYLFVLGVPNLSGAITASAEAGLQIVRLSSACPPCARRPHLQSGYLLGEYPDLADIDQKGVYEAYEIDFGRRLVAKFVFDPRTFWQDRTFPLVPEQALYPKPSDDPLLRVAKRVRASVADLLEQERTIA